MKVSASSTQTYVGALHLRYGDAIRELPTARYVTGMLNEHGTQNAEPVVTPAVNRNDDDKSKNAADAHNLDSTKPANVEPEFDIGGFDMSFLDVDALQQQTSGWIKIGVDTGAGKTAWPPECHIREEAFWSC